MNFATYLASFFSSPSVKGCARNLYGALSDCQVVLSQDELTNAISRLKKVERIERPRVWYSKNPVIRELQQRNKTKTLHKELMNEILHNAKSIKSL